MRPSKVLFAAGLALAVAAPMQAQNGAGAMPESYRTVQLNALRLQRSMLIKMVDSMPERLYRDKVTPIQRDFANQIFHAASAMPGVLSGLFHVPATANFDSAQVLNTRAGLRGFVNAAYDWAENTLRNQSAADRAATVNLFGTQMPAWQVWDEMHQHTIWTAGQIVANFRKNGMAPPGFGFF